MEPKILCNIISDDYFKFQELKDVLIIKAMENLLKSVNFHLAGRENCSPPAPNMIIILCGVQPKLLKTTNTLRANGVSVLHPRILIATKLMS